MSAGLDVNGRRALVLGLGRFTGGVETVRYLRARGADVVVSDVATRTDLEAAAREVESLGAVLVFGRQTPALLEGIDLDGADFLSRETADVLRTMRAKAQAKGVSLHWRATREGHLRFLRRHNLLGGGQ